MHSSTLVTAFRAAGISALMTGGAGGVGFRAAAPAAIRLAEQLRLRHMSSTSSDTSLPRTRSVEAAEGRDARGMER